MKPTLLKFWQSLLVVVLFAVSGTASADYYYIVGDLSGNISPSQENAEHYKNWCLDVMDHPSGEGGKILDVPAGRLSFYLVDGLEENATCYGASSAVVFDESGTCKMSMEVGSTTPFVVEDWTGGRVVIGTNGNEIVISKLDSKIYLAMWGEYYQSPNPTIENEEYYSDWVLNETSEGSGIYSGTFYINEGTTYIAFFDRLTIDGLGWSALLFVNRIGVDFDLDVYNSLTPIIFDKSGIAEFDINIGDDYNSGTLVLNNWRGGEIKFTVNLCDMTVTLDAGAENATKYIYLMGATDTDLAPIPENAEAYADWIMFESAIPGIYSGTFYIPDDKFNLCFFPPFTDDGWNATAYYAGTEEMDLEQVFENTIGVYADVDMTSMVKGGRWIVENWKEGEVSVRVNLNNNTVRFTIPSLGEEVMFVVGAFTGWRDPSAGNLEYYRNYMLIETPSGSGVYENTFEIPAGEAMFRFYKELTGWDGGDSWGYQIDDYPTEFSMSEDGIFQSEGYWGKGSWSFPDWDGGKMKMTVHFSSYTTGNVTFRDMDSSGIDGVELSPISIVPGVGCVTVSGADYVVIYNTMGVQIANEATDGNPATINLPTGLYIVNGVKTLVR